MLVLPEEEWSLKRLIPVLGAALVAVGIAVGVLTSVGRTSEESAKVAISELVDRRYDARLKHDLDSFMNTVDPARVFFRECERQGFEAFVRANETPHRFSVGRVDKWGDYFRVWLATDEASAPTFVRYDGMHWYLSEPFPSELGERRTKAYAGIKVHYQAANEDLATVIGADLKTIMDTVLAHAVEPPAELFELEISTLEDRAGDCFIAGSELSIVTTTITLNFPALTPAHDHISRDTAATIEHEALHWLQFDHATRLKMREPPWWVIEGWPALIADQPTPTERRLAVCTSAPTFDDLRVGPRRDAKVEDVARAYTIAAMLVERVSGSSGDSGYWRFFDEFAGTTDPYLHATGSDGRSFYFFWLDDARRQYC